MSGQSLMCVWQAVAATDTSVEGEAPTSSVRDVTREFARPPKFRFSVSAFRNMFSRPVADFETYRVFLRSEVIVNTTPLHQAEADIEKFCWERCRPYYKFGTRSKVTVDDLFRLWQMFNRISTPGSCPPVISVSDMNWWASKIAVPMTRMWTDLPEAATEPLTFLDAVKVLNERVFSRDSLADAQRSIEQLHAWLVREVSMTGWMSKRTRKQGNNWTTWQRRYFILSPAELHYFSSARAAEKDHKGKVSITATSRLEPLPDYKSLARKYPNRYRISNIPTLEIELSSVIQHEKNAWMAAVEEVIEACKNGTTPVQAVLNERIRRNQTDGPKETIDQALSRLKSVRLSKVPTKLLQQDDEPIYSAPTLKAVSEARSSDGHTPQSSFEETEEEEEEEFDNNTYSFQKQKVKELFDRIDKNGNGLLNEREFDEFIRVLVGKAASEGGVPVSVAIFADIDEDGDTNITFEEFYSYFTKLVLEPSPATEAESLLREEFLRADREGNAALNFGDLSEFVWERRRSFRYQGLMTAFENMDKNVQADRQFPQLKEFVVGQCAPVNETQMGSKEYSSGYRLQTTAIFGSELGQQIRDIQGDGDTGRVARSLTEQWFEFVKEKGLVASEPQRIARNYNLIDVACFTKDSGQQPKNLSVDAARWEALPDPAEPADLIFPVGSPLTLPVVDATDDFLKYYGCRLADDNQEQIATLYHHEIRNMTYANQGLAALAGAVGGPGMEKSSTCCFLCPLSSDSGHLMIARWEGDEESLEITAFRVTANTSVYISAGTIFSLDYLKGSWRVLAEDDAKVSFAFLKRQFTSDNDRDLENIRFELNE